MHCDFVFDIDERGKSIHRLLKILKLRPATKILSKFLRYTPVKKF